MTIDHDLLAINESIEMQNTQSMSSMDFRTLNQWLKQNKIVSKQICKHLSEIT